MGALTNIRPAQSNRGLEMKDAGLRSRIEKLVRDLLGGGGVLKDPARFCERYMRDPAPVRLGNLASDLVRLGAWVQRRRPDASVDALLRQIATMLACNGDLDLVELADMQRELCRWRRAWPVE